MRLFVCVSLFYLARQDCVITKCTQYVHARVNIDDSYESPVVPVCCRSGPGLTGISCWSLSCHGKDWAGLPAYRHIRFPNTDVSTGNKAITQWQTVNI